MQSLAHKSRTFNQKGQYCLLLDGVNERIKEAEMARKIMGVEREILNFGDKNISLSEKHRKEIKKILNDHDPYFVFAPYFIDKHPDHVNTAKLVSENFNKEKTEETPLISKWESKKQLYKIITC